MPARSGLLLAVLGFAAGCAAAPAVSTAPSAPQAAEAPPPPRLEEVAPRAGFVWVRGRWLKEGREWTWLPGHWERERPGRLWRDGRWERQGEEWRWVEGGWTSP